MDDTNPNPPPPPTLQNPPFAFGPPQNPQLVQHQVPGGTGTAGPAMVPDVLAAELSRIPPPSLAMLKQDLRMADKDVTAMTREEKIRLVQRFRYGPMMPASSIMHPSRQQQTRVHTAIRETGTEITPEMLDAELDGIPPPTLAKLKRKLGMAGKDVAMMTPQEKRRLMQLFREGDGRPRPNTGMPLGPGPAQVLPVGGGHNAPVYRLAPPSPPPGPLIPPLGTTGHLQNIVSGHDLLYQPPMLPGHNQSTTGLRMQQYTQMIQNLATMPQSLTAAGAPSGTAGRPTSQVPPPWSGSGSAAPADVRTPYALGGPVGAATAPRTPPVHVSGSGSGVAGPSFSSAPMPTRTLPVAPDGRLGNPNPSPDPPSARFDPDAYLSQLTDELSRSLDWESLNAAWRSGLASAQLEGLGS